MPKQDLMVGLRVMLKKRELGLRAKFGPPRVLVKELPEMESWMGSRDGLKFGARREGAHDDLMMASALACWRARRRTPGFGGRRVWGCESNNYSPLMPYLGADFYVSTEGGVSYSGDVKTKATLTVKRIAKLRRAPKRKRIAEDEDDYRTSQKSIRSGRPIPLSKVLKELGYRVER